MGEPQGVPLIYAYGLLEGSGKKAGTSGPSEV
jgi:hypothetical protein